MAHASDELNTEQLQNAEHLYDDVAVSGRPAARTRGTEGRRGDLPGDVAALRSRRSSCYRSALPVAIIEGLDTNPNGEHNDLPEKAYAFDGFDDDGQSASKEIGNCETLQLRPWRQSGRR